MTLRSSDLQSDGDLDATLYSEDKIDKKILSTGR